MGISGAFAWFSSEIMMCGKDAGVYCFILWTMKKSVESEKGDNITV